jgi:hypothetical protein
MRTILFVLALLGATVGRAQIFLDWYGAAAPAAGLLLDDYPNAAAAYSLRKLRTAYTGNCVQVRRSSDNTTQNIAFLGNIADTTAIKTFCAGTDCFVSIWYDQSLNARNATQTTNANQPRIILSGAFTYEGGWPTVVFDGSNDHLRTDAVSATFTTTSQKDYYAVGRGVNNAYGNFVSAGTVGTTTFIRFTLDNTQRVELIKRGDNGVLATARSGVINNNTRALWTSVDTGTNATIYRNNTIVVNNVSFTTGTGNFTVGGIGALVYNSGNVILDYLNGNIQEIVLYNTNQTPSGIHGNINAFYSIY